MFRKDEKESFGNSFDNYLIQFEPFTCRNLCPSVQKINVQKILNEHFTGLSKFII